VRIDKPPVQPALILRKDCDRKVNVTAPDTVLSKKKGTYYKCSKGNNFFPQGATAPSGPGPPHYRGFTITFRHTTLGRTPLDEWSARRRDLYLTKHNTHKRQTNIPPAVFENPIPAKREAADPLLRPHGHWDRSLRVVISY